MIVKNILSYLFIVFVSRTLVVGYERWSLGFYSSVLSKSVNNPGALKIGRAFFKIISLFTLIFAFVTYGSKLSLKNYVTEIESKWPPSKSLNVSHYVQLDKQTASVLPSKPCAESTFVLIVVESARKNFEKREAIRETYGQWIHRHREINRNASREDIELLGNTYSNNHSVKTDHTMNYKLVFLIGQKAKENEIDLQIQLESSTYDDIILEDFIDDYYNLTLKSVLALKYFRDFYNDAKFLVKVDDDVFLHIPNLHNYLLQNSLEDRRIMGQLLPTMTRTNNPYHKNYIPEYMMNTAYAPSFMMGPTYIIPGNLVEELLKASHHVPLFLPEDVYITGYLADEIGGILKTDVATFAFDRRFHDDHCLFQKYITAYPQTPPEQKLLWKQITTESIQKKCRKIRDEEIFNIVRRFFQLYVLFQKYTPECIFKGMHYIFLYFMQN